MARSSHDSPYWSSPAPAWLVYVVLLLAVAMLAWRLWPASTREYGNDPSAAPLPIAPGGDKTSDEKNRIEIFSKEKDSVVNVSTAKLRRNSLTLSVQQIPKGQGSGFIWDKKGRVVTNYHVVEDSDQVRVTLDDNSTWNVYRIRYSEAHDLAVLWTDIPESKRKPVRLGKSSELQVGQSVLAIGNPFGLDHSLSAGIISALGRDMKTDEGHINRGLIQTDAAINPGNSGGPLLDSSGRVIGVNTSIISPTGTSAGIGFAIPVDVVNRVVPQLIKGVKDARPGLGIVEAPDQWAQQRRINGVILRDVIADGPADKAKLRPTTVDDTGRIHWGDVIVGVDDHPVHNANELFALLAEHYKIGQEVTLHILRDGEATEVKLTLSASSR